jgi:hypothetical protein
VQGSKVSLEDDALETTHPASAILFLTIDPAETAPAVEKIVNCRWFVENKEIKVKKLLSFISHLDNDEFNLRF